MASERNKIERNVNGSKNTRMNIDHASQTFAFRKDEIMHIGRYFSGAQTIVDLAKELDRPLRVLDIGCGELCTARLLYHSYQEKKSDIIEVYQGIDIDDKMVERFTQENALMLKTMNADIMIQDLTETPDIEVEDNFYDVIICYEFLEHINPEFAPAILEEAYRVLNPEGIALFSTPNSNGSNSKLPKDHFYEYSYEECIQMFEDAEFEVVDTVGVCINSSKLPKEEKVRLADEFDRAYTAFGRNSAFASVVIAPLVDPTICKNVLYKLVKPE